MNGFSTLKPHSKGLKHSDFTASLPFFVLISGQRGEGVSLIIIIITLFFSDLQNSLYIFKNAV